MDSYKLQSRPWETFPASVRKKVQLLSYKKHGNIVGSYSFRSQLYPSDVDVMDTVEEWYASEKELVTTFVTRFKKIVADVKKAKDVFYVEVKAGYDLAVVDHFYPIGDMCDGVFTPSFDLIHKIGAAEGRGWLSHDVAHKMYSMLRYKNLGAAEYEYISGEIRKLYVLRWSADEITKGCKTNLGHTIKLELAVCMPTLLKMDVMTEVSGRYVEMSMIYVLVTHDEDETTRFITAHPRLENVSFDVEKMLFSPNQYNPYKAIKRMFVYARMKVLRNDDETGSYKRFVDEVLDYLGEASTEAILYQVKSDIETMTMLCEKFPSSVDHRILMNMVESIAPRLESTKLDAISVDKLVRLAQSEDYDKLEKAIKEYLKSSAERWIKERRSGLILFLPDEMDVKIVGKTDPMLTMQHIRTYEWLLPFDSKHSTIIRSLIEKQIL